MGEMRNAYKILVGKLGRHRRRWEDNIIMDFKEIRRKGVDWINVAQNRGRGGIL
jgi:hypothetical protein